MDPVSAAIITGLAAGVAGGTTEVGKNLIVDAYSALKAALMEKFGADSDVVEAVEHLEKKPEAKSRQAGVEEEVKGVKADEDPDILAAAQALLDKLKEQPSAQQNITQTISNVKYAATSGTGNATISDIKESS